MLRAGGHQVTGVDTGFFLDGEAVGDVEGHRIDVRRIQKDLLLGVDAVVHLAALSNDPLGQLDPGLTSDINFQASVRLARLSRDAGVRRFILSSSCSLYGAAGTSDALGEEAPLNPITAYARSKVDSEKSIARLANEEFSPIFLRNATAYGLSPAMRFDLVVNNLVGWALTTGRIRLESDGSAWRPLVHVLDISRAVIAAVEAPQAVIHNQVFNVGRDDQNFRVREIAEAVHQAVPECTIEMATGATADARSYRVSFAKAAARLTGFKPEWTVERGVGEIVDFFRSRGLTKEQFQGRSYVRLAQVQYLRAKARLDSRLYWTGARG